MAYVFPRIVIAPVAAQFNPKETVFNDSTIIFVPDKDYKDFPWDTYFNSALVRFVYHTSLRTGVLLRRRSSLYGRTVERFPISEKLFQHKKELGTIAEQLRELSPRIKQRWDLIGQAIDAANKNRLSALPVDFSTWTGTAIGTPTLTKIDGKDSLTMVDEDGTRSLFYVHSSMSLLKMIKYLLSEKEEEEEEVEVSATALQRLEVPSNYEEIVQMIEDAQNPNSPDIARFRELADRADEIIEKAFELSEADRTYIHKRLSEYPLSVFEPRYPWTAGAHHQKTRVYARTSRFA